MAHLDALDAELRKPVTAIVARYDLPPEVVALASRMGANAKPASSFAEFDQSGQMWWTPGGKPIDFSAHQTVRVDTTEFLWRASTRLPLNVVVADYFVGGTGGLEVMLFGALPLARMIGGAGANRGETLRYLAELPWNPDAILANTALDWTVVNHKTIKVATGNGPERGEVTLTLDENGLIAHASALSRLYVEKGRTTARPWHGRFWDYQRLDDRLIPMQAEVAWTLDAGEFVYWRRRILIWRTSTMNSDHQGD